MIPQYMRPSHRKPVTYREFDPMTRLHMSVFIRRVFAELHPGATYLDNFHIHAVIEALEEVRRGQNLRLAVALPPRGLKSVVISVGFVAWLLGHDPSLKIVCVSYGQELSDKLASDCRQVMTSDWYRRLFPQTWLRQGRQSLANFETTMGGGRFSTSVGGALTGFGADVIIIDDPMNPNQALSEAERVSGNQWIQHTLFTRLNNKRTGRIVLVQQRLHMDDLIGNLEEKAPGSFRILSFAAIAQKDELHDYATPFGRRQHQRLEGEALHPERESIDDLKDLETRMGSQVFSAQYLQAPVPTGGNLVKRDWLRRYIACEVAKPNRIVQSWDTASKVGQLNDYSVCTTWAMIGERYYLLDVVRQRLEFPALKQRVIEEADRWKAELVLIEDKGSGMSLLQDLQSTGFWKGRAVSPVGDKASRLVGVTAMIEAGRLLLPHSAVWLPEYELELCGFPGLRHDDQVDSTSQAFDWFRNEGNPGGLWHYYRQENEKAVAYREHRTVQLGAPHGVNRYGTIDGVEHIVGPDGTLWLTEEDSGRAEGAGFARLSPRI